MSATVGDQDRTHGRRTWRGERISATMVAAQLSRLNREHVKEANGGHAATRTLNLLVAAGDDVPFGSVRERLDAARVRHPSRTIVLREHAEDRLDAYAEIDCTVTGDPGAVGLCHDIAALWADEGRLRHADSLVKPLLIYGLPIVLWLPGAQHSPVEEPLARLSHAVVLDSGAAPAPREALMRAHRLGAAASVRDLAWIRMRRWRQRIASTFDNVEHRVLLARADRLDLRFTGPDAAAPLLLAGWIIARAGWTLRRLGGAGETWGGAAQRPDGGELILTLGSFGMHDGIEGEAADEAGIHELILRADDEALRIVEPVTEPNAPRVFATALRTLDEPTRGYEAALAAIGQGLAAA